MGRRTVREFRAGEALTLIGADRDQQSLVCPSCGATTIERTPPRAAGPSIGRITLRCNACSRSASYIERAAVASPEAPRVFAAAMVAAAAGRARTRAGA
ncbi:MAG: hypothetical protein SFU84_06715 [Gemmatimonadales bacterium]|nr:hypothetical protein [Gemmatimonadales bacterium]